MSQSHAVVRKLCATIAASCTVMCVVTALASPGADCYAKNCTGKGVRSCYAYCDANCINDATNCQEKCDGKQIDPGLPNDV